jgi:hypothetical protein
LVANDSVSLIDLKSGQVVAEQDLRRLWTARKTRAS